MRLSIAILILCTFLKASAQELKGKIIDGRTKSPISGATVTASSRVVFSQAGGFFRLHIRWYSSDTLKVSCVGYKPYEMVPGQQFRLDTLLILLQPQQVMLNQVVIKGSRDYKLDSLKSRKDYGSVFSYKGTQWKDVFINPSSTAYSPYSYNHALNNTTQLVNVNVLALIALVGKSKAPVSRFQKTLIRDEEANYVDHAFSKIKVSSLTAMKGDSLQAFMDTYRPTAQQLREMSEYELMIYIKRNSNEFIKTSHHANTSPFKK